MRLYHASQIKYVVFGFGLIHGLGFASILQELALPSSDLITALVSFNLGIEIGQLAIVALLWGGLAWLSQKETWYNRIQTGCASLIIVVAGFWLLERVFW